MQDFLCVIFKLNIIVGGKIMSKKSNMEAFIKGMEAGAKPFEEKFQAHAEELKKSKKQIMHQITEVASVQDEMLDIEMEHEESLEKVNQKIKYGLEDKETIGELEKADKEILGGLLFTLSREIEFNENQKTFVSNVFRMLGISQPQEIDFDIVDSIESIRVQKIILQVLMETMFLKDLSVSEEEDFEEAIDYFSISKKQIDNIKKNIEDFYRATGANGLVNKYCVSEEEIEKKRKKQLPKLEVDTDFEGYTENGSWLILTCEDSSEALMETFKSKRTAESKYEGVIKENYRIMMEYMDESNANYMGKPIVDYYCEHINRILNQIIDYNNIYKLRMSIDDIQELRDSCEKDLWKKVNDEVRSVKNIYNDYGVYMLGMQINETEEYVETFLSGFKEMVVFEPDFDAAYAAVDKMTKDLQFAEKMVDMGMNTYVRGKYILRIIDIVQQINQACGNIE